MTMPLFKLVSPNTQVNAPFTFGHVFAKGDVPAGSYVDSDLTDWQAVPTTYWPDGSVRHATIAGRVDLTANVLRSIQISVSGTNRSGTALSEADLASALPVTTLACGAETITLGALVGTAALHKTVYSGPVMSNWIYRKQLAGSNHLVAWFDVRLYKGGVIEIFPWIENGYLFVASPTNDSRTYTLTIGGVQKFSQTLDIKHHTRPILLSGTAHSYWTTDPQITPQHDAACFMASKMVPNYPVAPSETLLSGVDIETTYTPNSLGTTKASMANTGYGNHIGILPAWAASFLASGADARAYRATIMNGMAAGSWPVHYRDENTNEPLKFSDWPNISIAWGGTPSIPSGTGGVNQKGGFNAGPDRAHQPSLAFVPWLLTGRWYFLDEQLFWFTWNYNQMNYITREGAKAIYFDDQTRSRGWCLRTHGQTLAILPSDHPCYAPTKSSWEENTKAYEERYISGTRDSGTWANNLGVSGMYNGDGIGGSAYFSGSSQGYWWEANWQQAIFSMSFGTAWDMDVPQSVASKASHLAMRNFVYRVPVGMAGDGSAGTYNYRRFATFEFPVGTDDPMPPNDWLDDYGQVYAAQEAYGYDNPNRATGTVALPALPAGTDVYYGNRPVAPDEWSYHSAIAFGMVALAYAAEHGVSGAAEGLTRLTSASNYNTTYYRDFNSIWSIAPRATSGETPVETVSGKSYRFDEPLVPGKYHFGNRGLGVLGSAVPTTGTHGGGLLAGGLSSDELDKEVRLLITQAPLYGTLDVGEDSGFTYTRTDGQTGSDSVTFTKYVSGVSKGSATKALNVGVVSTVSGVTVSPSAPTVAGGGTQQFTASVQGTNSPSQAVSWSASAGSINSSGLYTAPAATSSVQTITITATSTQDSSKNGTATVTVPSLAVPTVSGVTVSPTAVSVAGGGTQQFTAAVQGTNSPSQAVTWSVTGGGTINSSGLYTAPATTSSPQNPVVIATSTQDSSKKGSATVTVPATGSTVSGVTISPTTATVRGGQSQAFATSVQGENTPSQAITWSTSAGSITAQGVFTAPAATSSAQQVTVTATSVQNGSKSTTVSITVPAIPTATSPSTFLVEVPLVADAGILAEFPKQPAEVLDYDVSFVNYLASIEDAAANVHVECEPGIILETYGINAGVVKVWVSGGTHNLKYKFTIRITTTGGRVKEVEFVIKVKET